MIELHFKPMNKGPRPALQEYNSRGIEGLEIVVCTLLEGRAFTPRILQPGYRIIGDTSEQVLFPGRVEGDRISNYELHSVKSRRVRELVSDVSPSLNAQPDHTLWTLDGEQVRYEPKEEVSEMLDMLTVHYTNQALATYPRSPEEANLLLQRGINARDTNLSAWAVHIAFVELEAQKEDLFLRKMTTQSYTEPDRRYVLDTAERIKEMLKKS